MQFHKNLSVLGWDEVKKRQLHRMPLVDEWISVLQMKKGDSVLDIGPGPGVFTLRYAETVENTGKVTALEKSKEAIEYLVKYLSLSNNHIQVILGDAEEVKFQEMGSFDIIMLTDILHHTDSPEHLLKNIYKNIHSNETRLLISEFDPESHGEFGPPLDKRLSEQFLLDILKDIGFTVTETGKQTFEHYYIIVHS